MIYFDNSATTKPSEASLSAMREALCTSFGNPSSVHFAGGAARRLMEQARESIASSLGIRGPFQGRVFFTSGGTEANNLAILGGAAAKSHPEKNGSRGKIIITDGEHSSVENPARQLESQGFTLVRIPTVSGKLDLETLETAADSTTVLCAFMLVNNETGALYDIKSAAAIVRKKVPKALIHCDAVQAYMKTKLLPTVLGVDTLSVSSHKIFAPKGAGALYVKNDVTVAKRLVPTVFGGGQEEGMRSGTENVPAIVAFGAAAKEGAALMQARIMAVENVRSAIISCLPENVRVNIPDSFLANIINITLPGIKSETMLNYLSGEGICVSAGSACSTHAPGRVSRALTAFGLAPEEADCSLRLSLSHENTVEEAKIFCKVLADGINRLARIRR